MENIPQVQLEKYSGPMDLLLDLVKKEEMDICQIDIGKITNGYLDYLRNTTPLNLEETGNFIKLASTLLLIKSRTLLPELELEEDLEEAENLKEDLLRLLEKYQQFQIAGQIIYRRQLLGRDLWSANRPFVSETPSLKEEEVVRIEDAPFLFVQSYGQMLEKKNKLKPHAPLSPIPSLTFRINQISSYLIEGAKSAFSRLANLKRGNHSVLLTFLSLLELSRLGFVSLFQKTLFSDIDVVIKKTIDFNTLQILNREERLSLNPENTGEPAG